MATSNLIIYEPLEAFGKLSDYWKSYIEFYELYWGSAPSPFGVWFGNEYKNFVTSLAERIDMDEADIKDCYFLKDKEGRYFLAPMEADEKNHIIFVENIIPEEWFLLFRGDERKSLFSHWGFNAIYYKTELKKGLERVEQAKQVYEKSLSEMPSDIKESELFSILQGLIENCDHLISLLSEYHSESHIILNYGDICALIHTYTIDNERSVDEIGRFTEFLSNKEYEQANKSIKMLFQKWQEIYENATGQATEKHLQ